jgi:hypothetical protein
LDATFVAFDILRGETIKPVKSIGQTDVWMLVDFSIDQIHCDSWESVFYFEKIQTWSVFAKLDFGLITSLRIVIFHARQKLGNLSIIS